MKYTNRSVTSVHGRMSASGFTTRSRMVAGFTLIELLVVIAIIGILATVVLASLNASRTKARDSQRAAQAQEILKALELYYSDNGYYPPTNFSTSGKIKLNHSSFESALVGGGYISEIPADPKYTYDSNQSYQYCSKNGSDTTPNFYVLYVNVEKDGDEDAYCYIPRGLVTGNCTVSGVPTCTSFF